MTLGRIGAGIGVTVIAVVGLGISGCATTPGRDKSLDGWVMEAVASPDGEVVAASTTYDEVALFERAPLKFRSLLTRETDRRAGDRSRAPFATPFALSSPLLAFSPDGRMIVAAGVAGQLIAWDRQSGNEKFRAALEPDVLDLVFYPDGQELLTVGPNAITWKAGDGSRAGALPLPAGTRAVSAAVSPDGKVTIVGLSDGRIAVFESANRRLLRTLEGHAAPVYGVAFSPDGTTFASTAGQYDPLIWKRAAEGEFGKGERGAIRAAAAAKPSQDQAAALGVLVWLLGTAAGFHVVGAPTIGGPPLGPGAEAQLAAAPGNRPDAGWCPPRVTFSPDGRFLASTGSFPGAQTGSLSGLGLRLFVTDLRKGETRSKYLGACSIAFTPDSRFLITRSSGTRNAPVFWDVATLEEVADAPSN